MNNFAQLINARAFANFSSDLILFCRIHDTTTTTQYNFVQFLIKSEYIDTFVPLINARAFASYI